MKLELPNSQKAEQRRFERTLDVNWGLAEVVKKFIIRLQMGKLFSKL